MDMDVDRVAFHLLAPRVKPFRQLLAREYPARAKHQRMKERVFARRQLDPLAFELDAPGGGIELDFAHAQQGRRFSRRATDQRAKARRKLLQVERLGHIVVSAAVESLDPVRDRIARRQNEHRRLVAACAHAPQQLETGETRQPQVEYHRRVGRGPESQLARDAVLHPIHAEAGLRQAGLNSVTQERIVFDNEDAHVRRCAERLVVPSIGRMALHRGYVSCGIPGRRQRIGPCNPECGDRCHERRADQPMAMADAVARLRRLVTREHGPHEVLPMKYAAHQHARDMHEHHAEQRVGHSFMHVLHPVPANVVVGGISACTGKQAQRKERVDRPSFRRGYAPDDAAASA